MNTKIELLKGIHPGLLLGRELGRSGMKSRELAASVGEYPQTISAIIRGRRSMNTALSIRIEQALGLEEGTLMTLQVFYDIAQEKRKTASIETPDTSLFRKALFWDTSFDKIDWQKHKQYVINRVFERGNEQEIKEIMRFYGKQTVLQCLKADNPYSTTLQTNIQKHIGDVD
ncbi:MAG: plasmid maintenance system antidote protein [Alistipes sp.]